MARKLNGIELTRYDDLFKTDVERSADRQERVQIVPAEQVFPYVPMKQAVFVGCSKRNAPQSIYEKEKMII